MVNELTRGEGSPRVTVGFPIYNGAATLAEAFGSLASQSFEDVEFVISDNASRDGTAEICQDFARRDPRVRYFRQPSTINPTLNFQFVLKQARAPFFMWAAHDDRRSPDSIALLLQGLVAAPSAILAFGEIREFGAFGERVVDLPFENAGLDPVQRLRREALGQLHHLYGLWRTDRLRALRWSHVDWWHDTPLMMAATLSGDYVRVPGAILYYRGGSHPFLDWKARQGPAGAWDHATHLARRSADVARLIALSARSVGAVAGPRMAGVAAAFTAAKILDQAVGFVRRRI